MGMNIDTIKRDLVDNSSSLNSFASNLFRVYWLLLVVLIFSRLDVYHSLTYYGYGVSDWLINYEGGFVRRGLGGQLLYWLYQLHPFDMIMMIKRIAGISSILFLLLLLYVFRREGWSLAILPLSCCLYFTIFQTGQRRDFLLLLMAYGLFVCYRNHLRRHGWHWLLLFMALSVVMVLFHESSFFFSIPICMVYGALSKRGDGGLSSVGSFVKFFVPFVPPVVAMAAVCHYSGNAAVASAIWNSWHGLFAAYPDGVESYSEVCAQMGQGVDALTWSAGETMRFHLFTNFVGDYGIQNHSAVEYFSVVAWLWMLAMTYFLTTHINSVDVSLYPLSRHDQFYRISNVMLVQLVFVMPFFTIISIDWDRTLPYWIFSSLLALHVFGDLRFNPVDRLSRRIHHLVSKPFFATSLCFLMAALLLPFVKSQTPSLRLILHLNLHL